MPGSEAEIQCPFCFEFKRKDTMVHHLKSHANIATQVMTIQQRQYILSKKMPIVYRQLKDGTLLYGSCLHCKIGTLSCSKRALGAEVFRKPHTECIDQFHRYESMFASTEEPKAWPWVKWVEKKVEVKPKKPKAVPVVEGGSTLPKAIEDDILKMWKLYEDARIADDKEAEGEDYVPEDEPEPDIMGKLRDILSDYDRKKTSLKRSHKTVNNLRDEISVLEHDIKLKDEQIKRLIGQ
jgi:hypothetical protein